MIALKGLLGMVVLKQTADSIPVAYNDSFPVRLLAVGLVPVSIPAAYLEEDSVGACCCAAIGSPGNTLQ